MTAELPCDPDLFLVLRCPRSQQPLAWRSNATLAQLDGWSAATVASATEGAAEQGVRDSSAPLITGWLISTAAADPLAYPVEAGIPIMLIERACTLPAAVWQQAMALPGATTGQPAVDAATPHAAVTKPA